MRQVCYYPREPLRSRAGPSPPSSHHHARRTRSPYPIAPRAELSRAGRSRWPATAACHCMTGDCMPRSFLHDPSRPGMLVVGTDNHTLRMYASDHHVGRVNICWTPAVFTRGDVTRAEARTAARRPGNGSMTGARGSGRASDLAAHARSADHVADAAYGGDDAVCARRPQLRAEARHGDLHEAAGAGERAAPRAAGERLQLQHLAAPLQQHPQ